MFSLSTPPSTPPRQPILDIHDPDRCWSALKKSQVFQPVPTSSSQSSSKSSEPSNSTRIVCISDTHGKHRSIPIPNCDILIHGGDLTQTGETKVIKDVDDYFLELQENNTVRDKIICIAGNHDVTFQPDLYQRVWKTFHPRTGPLDCNEACLDNCVYLQDELYTLYPNSNVANTSNSDKNIGRNHDVGNCNNEDNVNENDNINDNGNDHDNGHDDASDNIDTNIQNVLEREGNHNHNNHRPEIQIYGSPWSPTFGFDWGFNENRDTIQQKWDLIPKDKNIDILVTHGPPLGRGDYCRSKNRAGCLALLQTVQKDIKPRLHIFGHIHEDSGCSFDGQTLFVNASSVNLGYKPNQPCIVLDLPHDRTLPAQVVKPYSNLNGEEVIEWLRQKIRQQLQKQQQQQPQKQQQQQPRQQQQQHQNSRIKQYHQAMSNYEELIPFFENMSPLLTGQCLIGDDIDHKELGCRLQMHRESNWIELIRKLEHATLQLRVESYD